MSAVCKSTLKTENEEQKEGVAAGSRTEIGDHGRGGARRVDMQKSPRPKVAPASTLRHSSQEPRTNGRKRKRRPWIKIVIPWGLLGSPFL